MMTKKRRGRNPHEKETRKKQKREREEKNTIIN